MKNIHVLPTDKPSRLYKSKITQDVFISDNMSQHGDATYNVNIYITSDEEIKEGDCVIDNVGRIWIKMELCFAKVAKDNPYGKSYKIILTTDQDLIKDGVQKIADDFLEWFIQNPSCEEVEIRKEMYMPQSNGKISDGKITHEISLDPSQNTLPYYKIIIPKQEQCTCKEHDPYCCQIHGSCPTCVKKEEPKQTDEKGGPITFREGLEVSKYVMGIDPYDKQETLEELAKEFYSNENQLMERIAFKRGYAECKERMYSEEEVLKLLIYCKDKFGGSGLEDYVYDSEVKDWFEQLKKK